MAGIRPPLFSKGHTDDAAAYVGIGTGLIWLAGELAAGSAMAILGYPMSLGR